MRLLVHKLVKASEESCQRKKQKRVPNVKKIFEFLDKGEEILENYKELSLKIQLFRLFFFHHEGFPNNVLYNNIECNLDCVGTSHHSLFKSIDVFELSSDIG